MEEQPSVKEQITNEVSDVNYDFVVITASWCPFSSDEETIRRITRIANHFNTKINSKENNQFWTKEIALD